jgi:Zn finger protein HypA/HybF involved in hydrogenase expression
MPDAEVRAPIRCEECRRSWLDDERGWQAHFVDVEEVAFYCPECAEQEFGDSRLGE